MAADTNPPAVDVIVCVHNSPEDVEMCLASLLETLRPQDRAIIVDDGSQPETQRLCEAAAARRAAQTLLIRRDTGSGFCKAANAGLRASTADMVVLLNSDTVVAGDWLTRMERCMGAHRQIGFVGPLSNAGGWQSIPALPDATRRSTPMPADVASVQAVHAFCARAAAQTPYPIVELINGFCIGLSRDLLDTVGHFDEEGFPMGYGEEDDLVFRASNAGFLGAVATDCFVYHAKTKSYSAEQRRDFSHAGQVELRARYGADRIQQSVEGTIHNPILAAIRAQAVAFFEAQGWGGPEA